MTSEGGTHSGSRNVVGKFTSHTKNQYSLKSHVKANMITTLSNSVITSPCTDVAIVDTVVVCPQNSVWKHLIRNVLMLQLFLKRQSWKRSHEEKLGSINRQVVLRGRSVRKSHLLCHLVRIYPQASFQFLMYDFFTGWCVQFTLRNLFQISLNSVYPHMTLLSLGITTETEFMTFPFMHLFYQLLPLKFHVHFPSLVSCPGHLQLLTRLS
jgi:hypothetical protein